MRLEEALRRDANAKRHSTAEGAEQPSSKRSKKEGGSPFAIFPPIPDSKFYDKSTLRYVPPSGTRKGMELLKDMKDASESDLIFEEFPTQAEAFRFADARPCVPFLCAACSLSLCACALVFACVFPCTRARVQKRVRLSACMFVRACRSELG